MSSAAVRKVGTWGLVGEGTPADRIAAKTADLIEAFGNYLTSIQKSPKTVKEYVKTLRLWSAWWKKDPAAFGQDEWDQWTLHETERGLSGTCIRTYQAAVKRFFKYLRRKGLCSHDPAQNAEPVAVGHRVPTFMTEEEVAKLISRARSPRNRAILEMLYGCGLRNAELRSLRLENVTEHYVRVIGKRNKERLIPMPEGTYRAYKEYLKVRDFPNTDLAFLNANGDKIHDNCLGLMVKRFRRSAGIERRVTPHTLRHSVATHLMNRGMPLHQIQEFLGHSRLDTTLVYAHTAKDALARSVNQFHPKTAK